MFGAVPQAVVLHGVSLQTPLLAGVAITPVNAVDGTAPPVGNGVIGAGVPVTGIGTPAN
jgi:hypothetical protein